MEKICQNKVARFIMSIITALYILVLLYLTLFERIGASYSELSLQLLQSWKEWLNGNSVAGHHIVLCILGYTPMGLAGGFFFCGSEFGRFKRLVFAVVTALCLTIGIEICQLAFKLGYFEYDDMLAAFIGAMAGYLIFQLFNRLVHILSGKKHKKAE